MQVTIYIDDELFDQLNREAKRRKMSRSALAQQLIREGISHRKPERMLSTFGKIPNLELRIREHLGEDSPRATLD